MFIKISSESLSNLSKEARDLIMKLLKNMLIWVFYHLQTFERNKNTYLKRTYSKYKDNPKQFGEELRLRGVISSS